MSDTQRRVEGWDAGRAASFFDESGKQEWSRFEDGRTPAASLATHVRLLERFIRPATSSSTPAPALAAS